jgi:hypothetical protein
MTIFAALSLLSMPVDYKGGAELAHAHGLFQFWFPGGHAEVDFQDHHHGHQVHRDTQQADARRAGERTGDRNVSSTPDRPTISEMGTPAEKTSAIALSLLLVVLAILAIGRSPSWSNKHRLNGLVPVPELPPPRNLSSAST